MTKSAPFYCVLGLLFALCVGLAGRNDMLRDEQDMAEFADESRAGMVARMAEDQCGEPAIKTRRPSLRARHQPGACRQCRRDAMSAAAIEVLDAPSKLVELTGPRRV